MIDGNVIDGDEGLLVEGSLSYEKCEWVWNFFFSKLKKGVCISKGFFNFAENYNSSMMYCNVVITN